MRIYFFLYKGQPIDKKKDKKSVTKYIVQRSAIYLTTCLYHPYLFCSL